MKSAGKITIVLLILAMIFISFSGYLSQQNGNSTGSIQQAPQSSAILTPGTTSVTYKIRIDPIADYKTDSTFNITGSAHLVVNGTTNFPPGTPLNLVILEESKSRDLIRTEIEAKSNNSGANSFYYGYNLIGNPPGRYRVILKEPERFISSFRSFNITSETQYLKWIKMDPLGEVQPGGILPVSGTTDLPVGNEILIRTGISYHSCTMATPDRWGERSLCGGGCKDTGSQHTITVVEGAGGNNTWNSTVDSSAWCHGEEYSIGAFAVNWINATSSGQSIRL